MSSDLIPIPKRDLSRAGLEQLPAAIGRAGEAAAWRFVEFFAATIRNRNTRGAYANAVTQFFAWCEKHRVYTLEQMKPVVVAAYIEQHPMAAPTVKQHLAAIRMLFDFLVTGQVGYLKPHSKGPPYLMQLNTLPHAPGSGEIPGGGQLVNGDDLVGTLAVDCPMCKGNTFVVKFVWGTTGWFYEVPDEHGMILVPRSMTKELVTKFVEGLSRISRLEERRTIH